MLNFCPLNHFQVFPKSNIVGSGFSNGFPFPIPQKWEWVNRTQDFVIYFPLPNAQFDLHGVGVARNFLLVRSFISMAEVEITQSNG